MQSKLQLQAAAEIELRKRKRARLRHFKHQIEFYQKNPIQWMSDRLGIRKETIVWSLFPGYENHQWDGTPDPLEKIMTALVNNKWVGVESATGPGKTFIGAAIVLWFLDVYKNSLVVTTAPKQDQLSLHIWKEIGKMHPKFAKGDLTTLKLRMNPGKDDWIAVGFVAGVKADEDSATKAQGFHAEHMLIIIEETPGVPLPIITAFQNTSTAPHNLILAFGNPDHQLDNLHTFCLQDNVEHIRISAYDHPNVVLNDATIVPGASSLAGIRRIEDRYGKNHPFTLSRTRGISPTQPVDALIKIDWCLAAVERYKQFLDENGDINIEKIPGERGLGVDVANSEAGDKAAFCHGKGNIAFRVEDFQCPDSNQLGHKIKILINQEKINIKYLGIDGVGVGAGTINTLKEYGIRDKSINLQGSAKPEKTNKEENFNNLRSQMWWQAREDLRNGVVGMPNDSGLIADLTVPKFEVRNGKIVVESKEELKKRLGHSPNKGDAFVYWNWRRATKYLKKKTKAATRPY